MQMPNDSVARRRLYSTWGIYLLARLALHTVTKALHDGWVAVQKTLKGALGIVDEVWENRVMARAALEHADLVLDNTVRQVAAAVKVDLGGTTDKPAFQQVFKKLPSEVVALPLQAEIDEVKLIEKALETGPTWKAAKALLGDLKAAREALEKALAAYGAARLSHREAEDKLDDAEMNWRHSYRATYGALVEKFPADKRMQESFFWRGQDREDEPREDAESKPGGTV